MERLKSFLLLTVSILMSITVSAQVIKTKVAPQKLYCGSLNCSVPLPDYRLKISATDNCELASLVQLPAPGLILSNKLRNVNVTVKATDNSGNATMVSFPVSLIDTIAPVMKIDPTLIALTLEQIDRMYDIADRSMSYMMDDVAQLDTIKWPMAKYWRDSTYYKQQMIVWTAPGHARKHWNTPVGESQRWWTFGALDTTLIRKQ